jgi:nucleotide-binding universal stress UspA family protein
VKVLLCVDGSHYTKRMLGYVAAHEEIFGRDHDYIVFTALSPIPQCLMKKLPSDAIETYERGQAEDVIAPVVAFAAQKGWKVRAAHAVGRPAEAIAALAEEENPDLIVMGSHGHGAFASLALGSVATSVLARSTRPVLLVR